MLEKSIQFQNTNIVYRVIGNGKPVMLLHGFGENSTVWEPQIEALKNHYQLIIPDIPGSGKSALVASANIDTYAGVIKAICDEEKISQLHSLIGHSMGGYITLGVAEKYASLLNSFGLFHSSAFADTEEKKQTRKKAIEFIKEKGAYSFLKTSTPGLFTQAFKDDHSGKVDELIDAGKSFSNDALIQYYEAMIARPDRTIILRTFLKPILFIIGEHDQAIPFDSSLQQCHLPAQSHVHILRQSAHMGMWEEVEKANTILIDFLSLV